MEELTSRTRMLRSIDRQKVDHVPCCLMSFSVLRQRCHEDLYRLTEAELDLGLDSMLFIPTLPRVERLEHPYLRGLPVRFDPSVETVVRKIPGQGGNPDILERRYLTPGGELFCQVKLTEDWPNSNRVPFLDDYQVPRSVKPLITDLSDLPALKYLLTPPSLEDIAAFRAESAQAHTFVQKHPVILAGGWGVNVDMAVWLCNMEQFMIAMQERPEFMGPLLEIIHSWNMERMKVVLSAPVDLYIRRAWYEGCDMVTPRRYRQFILPQLKAEVELCHQHGTRFGYICTSGVGPILDMLLEAGIDVLIGVDPIQASHTDLSVLKSKTKGRIALWGGISGAITIELGNEPDVRQATVHALSTLGPDGFILSPVDNLTVDEPLTWRNLDVMINEWRQHQGD
jgi:uroporphyrinogen-III decarboxylase